MMNTIELVYLSCLLIFPILLVPIIRNKITIVKNKIFVPFLINIISIITGILIIRNGAPSGMPFFAESFMATSMCAGPLIYLYILSALKMWRRVPAAQFLHFAPPILFFSFLLLSYLSQPGQTELTNALFEGGDHHLYMFYRVFIYVSLISYFSGAAYFSHICRHKTGRPCSSGYWKGINFSRKAVFMLAIVLTSQIVFDILEYALPENFPDNLPTQSVYIAAFLYIGLSGMKNNVGAFPGSRRISKKEPVPPVNSSLSSLKPYILITGASAGLGRSMAEKFAQAGKNLLLVSLPGENLPKLARDLSGKFKVDIRYFESDLSGKKAPEQLASQILGRFKVDTLINNAGVGGTRKIEEASIEYIDTVIQLNIRALSMLTRLFLDELKRHPEAHIINISSLAAFSPMPYKSVYPASKAFVYSFSRGLREELKGTSVRVLVANPGPILTNPDIRKQIGKRGALAKLFTQTPEKVACCIFEGIYMNKAVVIPGLANHINRLLLTWIPEQLRLPILSRVWQTGTNA